MLERHLCDDPELPEFKRVHAPVSLDEIIEVVGATLDCDRQLIYESVRGRQNLARMLVAYFAHRAGRMTYREIAKALGMNHYSAVASSIRRLERLCLEEQQVRQLERVIREQLTLNET